MAQSTVGRSRRWRGVWGVFAAVVALCTVAAACSSSSNNPSGNAQAGSGTGTSAGGGTGSSGQGTLRNMLPASIRSRGYINDASSFDYPPWDLKASSGGYEGIEPDILNAIAPILGVKIHFVHLQGFATLIPAVASGRVDMAAESIGVLPDRRTQVSYAQYIMLEDGLLAKKGNPSGISVNNVCGHSVSVESGAEEVALYQNISKQCVKAGKKPVDVQSYSSESSQVLALQSGHADAVGVGTEVCAYIAKQSNGALEALPGAIPNNKLPAGMVVSKSNRQLGMALVAALKQLEKSGELGKILQKWGLNSRQINIKFLPATG